MKSVAALERIYERHVAAGTAMSAHLPRLRALSHGLERAVEFGVKRGASSSALLLGAKYVHSVDLNIPPRPDYVELRAAAGEFWTFEQRNTRDVEIPHCDLLLVDADHTYQSVKAELEKHADKVHKWLVFHDTITFGSVGAAGETGNHAWQYSRGRSVPPEHLGIRPAIDELMMRDWSWRIDQHYTDSHGLLVLWRKPA